MDRWFNGLLAEIEPTLWTSPAVDHPVPEGLFPWRRVSVPADGEYTERRAAARAAAKVLGVCARFPVE